jgi:hypothetical protein
MVFIYTVVMIIIGTCFVNENFMHHILLISSSLIDVRQTKFAFSLNLIRVNDLTFSSIRLVSIMISAKLIKNFNFLSWNIYKGKILNLCVSHNSNISFKTALTIITLYCYLDNTITLRYIDCIILSR